MCGIIGIFGNNDSKEKAHRSLETIVHRGSNTFELEYLPGAVFGANRLAIVDREHARQPQSNEDGTVFAVQNGEIFNYKELKEELIGKGHVFRTDSDTEVLAHLYEEYGPKMVERLDSEMFAFVIFDRKNGSIFAARDPLGVKPLYYAHDRTGQLYFASELKQLSCFEDIEEIHIFPQGSYFFDGEFTRYFTLKTGAISRDEHAVVRVLGKKIVEAVLIRVQTDLPIGVFLSGGVDSSLIMEIATRLHPDVTAIILGYPGSSDYEYALRLCQERKYKYHVVRPDVDYEKALDDVIYHLEAYEPNVIRHSFSLDICAREANRLGLKVVLVGEGSDELFAGYNEFCALPTDKVNEVCVKLAESLSAGQLQRVDRMSMKHTVEVRAPFFDRDVVDMAMGIDGSLKVKKEEHRITTKYILRKVAEGFLPGYIAWRYKIPFSNGAGMNVGNNFKSEDGDIAKIVSHKRTELPDSLMERYQITTGEEKYYLSKFHSFGFTKLAESHERLTVRENISDSYPSEKQRLLVGEFDRLALYFPVYYAAQKGVFDLHGLDVDFIATGGDDKTYASLVNNSAHIGLSDPLFAMFENKEGVKGEIIGELVNAVPGLAITLNPSVSVKELVDFGKYVVGTFEQYSTMNGVVRKLLPKETEIISFEHKTPLERLVSREIDIAIVLPEQAHELEVLGGRIIRDFREDFGPFLFTGFTVANILEEKYRKHLKSFTVAVRESVGIIRDNQEEAKECFRLMFPELTESDRVFETYIGMWSTTIEVGKDDYRKACAVWKENYPELLREYTPYFNRLTEADRVLERLNGREFRRDFPFLEDVLEKRILEAKKDSHPLRLVGFWGAGGKPVPDAHDEQTIRQFEKYITDVCEVFEPGIDVTWILADKHAENNGYPESAYISYLERMKERLENAGFKTVNLSELWQKWGLDSNVIRLSLESMPSDWWSTVSIAGQLERQARKRTDPENAIESAQQYYMMRKLEKPHLEEDFDDSIFFGYSDGRTQSILPTLPSLYLYTERAKISDVPWFNVG